MVFDAILYPHARFIGRWTIIWGLVVTFTGLVTFALDVAFAISLQRFLSTIGLIGDPSNTSVFYGPSFGVVGEMIIFLSVGIGRLIGTWVNSTAAGLCHVAFEARQRRDIMLWALHSGRVSLGEMTTLFNDVVIGSAAAVANCFYLVGRAVLTIGTIVALAVYSLEMTTVLLLGILLIVPLYRFVDARLGRISRVIQTSLADSVAGLLADVKNSVFLQIHGIVGYEVRRVGGFIDQYAQASRQYYASAATRALVPQLLGLFIVTGVAMKGLDVLGGNNARVVAYLYLSLRFFQSLAEIARVSANLRLNWPRVKVLRHWWDTESLPAQKSIGVSLRQPNPVPFDDPVGWRLRNVSFQWEAGKPIIHDLSVDLAPGSMSVVVGVSGVGKSTLLLLLAGLVRPTSGSISLLVGGAELELGECRERLLATASYVGPDPFVVPGTIRDVLTLGLAYEPDDLELAAALLQAHCDFIGSLPSGLDRAVTEQGAGLSEGQKQRLALARALLRKPRVLFLDEATANLDSETELSVARNLEELKGQMTIVAITHREALRPIADHLLTLEAAGQIKAVSSDGNGSR